VQRVYWLNGHVIPRDAYQQAASDLFEPVEKENLRAGDLLLFASKDDSRGRGITHVGMALDSARFIHASTRYSGVSISPFEDTHYGPQYTAARRLKGA
jgi:cell wall-associated NlpC family hydrolase